MAVEALVALVAPARRAPRIYKRTQSIKHLGVGMRRQLEAEYAEDLAALGGMPERPRVYGDCEREGLGVTRACPWVGCSHHLALDVTETGAITYWWPDRDVTEIPTTCVLGAVRRHPDGMTLSEVGALTNITRERIRQIEAAGLRALRELSELARVQDEVP